MEDAAEALKMAFSVFAFVIALGIAMTTFNQSKRVSDIVINSHDTTYLGSHYEASEDVDKGRKVGIENLIPTIYRYHLEDFSVNVIKSNNSIEEVFDLEIEGHYKPRDEDYEDEDEYTIRFYDGVDGYGNDIIIASTAKYKNLYPDDIRWLGTKKKIDIKKRIDLYIDEKSKTDEEAKVNGETLKKYQSVGINFNRNYYLTFGEKYTGNRYSTVESTDSTYDGTYFITESGKTMMKLIYKVT